MKQKVEIDAGAATERGGWDLILNTTMDLYAGSPNPYPHSKVQHFDSKHRSVLHTHGILVC